MATLNPYAPPQAQVADVHEDDGEAGVQPVKTWSARGRIGRLRFLAHSTGAYVLVMLVSAVGGFLGAALHSQVLTQVFMWGAMAACYLFLLLKSIQRSHDMDWSGWTILLAIIPLVGFIWVFKAGSKGSNRFGAPPPANTLGVKILGLLFPVLFVVGIIAAVALPAYQSYAKRAHVQQVR